MYRAKCSVDTVSYEEIDETAVQLSISVNEAEGWLSSEPFLINDVCVFKLLKRYGQAVEAETILISCLMAPGAIRDFFSNPPLNLPTR